MPTMQLVRLKWIPSPRHLRRLCTTAKRASTPTNLEAVVGLEVHMQIDAESKLFSSAPTGALGATNKQVAPFDIALPGTLPVLNRRCVEAAVKTAIAFNCNEINNVSRFDRKHYFYADMPAGYQITQQYRPIARNGHIQYFQAPSPHAPPTEKTCRILQIQLEQDSGKSIHDTDYMVSLIDLNRAGVGLLEIIFAPELRSGEEAQALIKELIAIIKAIGVCSGRMEEGAVRVDANVSVHEPGTPLGTRTEVKNLNSARAVSRAVNYEIKRQMSCVQRGETIENVTLTFDSVTETTVRMRDKEVLQDYRFFPEPNLPLLNLEQAGICVETFRNRLPPLPHQTRKHLMDTYNLEFWKAVLIVREKGFYELFTQTMNQLPMEMARQASHTLLVDMLGYLNKHSLEFDESLISPKHFAELIRMLVEKRVSRTKVVQILYAAIETKESPKELVERNNWSIVNDEDLLGALCEEAMRLHPNEARKARLGKERALNPMLKHIRLATQNRACPYQSKELLLKKLQESEHILREEINSGR